MGQDSIKIWNLAFLGNYSNVICWVSRHVDWGSHKFFTYVMGWKIFPLILSNFVEKTLQSNQYISLLIVDNFSNYEKSWTITLLNNQFAIFQKKNFFYLFINPSFQKLKLIINHNTFNYLVNILTWTMAS